MPSRRLSASAGFRCHKAWTVVEVCIAEAVGTAMLMFFGCMGMVRWDEAVDLPPLQPAIVFSVVVATIIQIFGHISAAHLNPAVTIAFTLLGKTSSSMAVLYVLSDTIGAILGYGLLYALTPSDVLSLSTSPGLCCTIPHQTISSVQALAMEFCATFFLVMVVCASDDSRNFDKTDSTPLKFGCTILALSITVGPYTGASMNPARSLAPALWTGTWDGHWIYWLGPCLGGFTATVFYQAMFSQTQTTSSPHLEEAPLNRIKVESQQNDIKDLNKY